MLLTTFTVTSTSDVVDDADGVLTLREAMEAANNNPNVGGRDVIAFNIPVSDPGYQPTTESFTIRPTSSLPHISDPVILDGYTQPGASPNSQAVGSDAKLKIELDGSLAGDASGLTINANDSTIRGFVINRFGANATNRVFLNTINIVGGDGSTIEGNYLGTDVNGTMAHDNGWVGVFVHNTTSGNIIGSNGDGHADAAERNVISGHAIASGIQVEGQNNLIAGNYIGTTADGMAALRNHNGVLLGGVENTLGGTTSNHRNVISGNGAGVKLTGREGSNNLVHGNYIGLNAVGEAGEANLGNFHGISVLTPGQLIGGSTPGTGNIISGSTDAGISISAPEVVIEGNWVGLNAAGDDAVGNRGSGIAINPGMNNVRIGGAEDGAGNVISGNNGGIVFSNNSPNKNVVVQGNIIGLNPAGDLAIGNATGIILKGSNNTIGGRNAAERNVISGNRNDGVWAFGGQTTENVIQGNYIGTDISGTLDLGNGNYGINLERNIFIGSPFGNLIGTNGDGQDDDAERNIVSGNDGGGIAITGLGTDDNVVAGNFIGVDATGTNPLGNSGNGVLIEDQARGNIVGVGVDQSIGSEGNLIAHNTKSGVGVAGDETWNNTIRGNSMHSNGGLGINLGDDAVTPNDEGDADTGPNQLLNFPTILSAMRDIQTHILAEFEGAVDTSITFDFYASLTVDATGSGEGQQYLGRYTDVTDGTGMVQFDVDVAATAAGFNWITATATDALGNTSEFSLAVHANGPPTADTGGPYLVLEGGTVVLDAAGSSDPDQATETLTYEWDFNGDGEFDDASGIQVEFSASELDGPGRVPISVRVTDNVGISDIAFGFVDVKNVAPTITRLDSDHKEPCNGSDDGVVTIDGEFDDPAGLLDTHTVELDWGDGVVESLAGSAMDQQDDKFSASHTYEEGGVYTIRVRVLDDDDGVSLESTTNAVVQGVGTVHNTLYIIGTEGRDHVNLKFKDKKDELRVDVMLNQGGSDAGSDGGSDGGGDRIKRTFTLSSVDQIVSYLCGGNDHYNGGGGGSDGNSDGGSDGGSDGASDGGADAAISQFIFGGAGNDYLQGGPGNDVLSGAGGRDKLYGRNGSDILIGGEGKDKLKGGSGDDLLIGGSTADQDDFASVDAALADWTSGLPAALADALIDLGALTDDGDEDDLKGENGTDTLLGGVSDKLKQ